MVKQFGLFIILFWFGMNLISCGGGGGGGGGGDPASDQKTYKGWPYTWSGTWSSSEGKGNGNAYGSFDLSKINIINPGGGIAFAGNSCFGDYFQGVGLITQSGSTYTLTLTLGTVQGTLINGTFSGTYSSNMPLSGQHCDSGNFTMTK